MQTVTPHLTKLKEKHKKDAARLQKETMALYKEHGINPVAGCLPVLLQLPIIWGLYSVLQHIVALKPEAVVGTVNKIAYSPALHLVKPWDNHFFGLPLSIKSFHHLGFLVVLVLHGLFNLYKLK
jgi:YidC/Oxa1 family membrane protein insertase